MFLRHLLAAGLLLTAASMHAQITPSAGVEGTWSGTYTDVTQCDTAVRTSGTVQFFAVQSGSSVTGMIVVDHAVFCSLAARYPLAVPLTGTITGTNLTMTSSIGNNGLLTATVSGGTLTGTFVTNGSTSQATLTRTSNLPPSTAFGGNYAGSYVASELPCLRPPQTSYTNVASASLSQVGGGVAGSFSATGERTYHPQPNGTCPFTTASAAAVLSARVNGSQLTGIFLPADGSDPQPFTGTISGNTISGTVIGSAAANESATFTLTRSGSTGAPPQITSFAALPNTIRAGQFTSLAWATVAATTVTLDNGIGLVPSSGAQVVRPSTTTTYTLTAVQGTATVTATVRVEVLTAAVVNVNSLPQTMLQSAGSDGGAASYTLTNSGGAATTITLTQNGSFFTQSPASFTLQAGASQTVTITGTAQSAGSYEGTSVPSGTGVPAGLQIGVKLLSAAAPSGNVTATPPSNRIDVAAPASTSPAGSVSFRNSGTARLSGVLNSDQPWLVPQTGTVTIDPGQTGTFSFTTDRTKRVDAAALTGSAEANLTLTFLSGSGSSFAKAPAQTGGTIPSVSLVRIVDTVQPSVTTAGVPALTNGEVGLVIPGVGHVTGIGGTSFATDISILNPLGSKPVDDVKFYYTPSTAAASASRSTSLPSVPGQTSVAVADIVKNVFSGANEVGTLHLRSRDAAGLAVAATVLATTTSTGTYGNAVPVFRTDRSTAAGGAIVLAGIRRDATAHTNLYVQEVAGSTAIVQIDFLAADGTIVGTARPPDTIDGFRLLQLVDVVPSTAVAAIITNNSTAGGRIVAYATPVDEASGDTWAIADWSTTHGYAPNEPVVVPVAGSVHGANDTFYRTDLTITNRGVVTAAVVMRYVSRTGTSVEKSVTLGAKQSSVMQDVVGTTFGQTSDSSGFIVVSPASGSIAVASRTFTTSGSSAATFGTGVPTLGYSSALTPGATRPIAGLNDASRSTVVAGRPGTFRTNVGLLEAAGAPVTVRVTFRFTFAAGAKTQGTGSASRAYAMNANQFLFLNSIAGEILGAARLTYGDLTNVEADFQVIAGSGAVMLFTSSVDNATGDSILRTE